MSGNLRKRAREHARQQQAFDLALAGLTYAQVAASPWACMRPHEQPDPLCSRCRLYHDARGAHRAVERYIAAERALSQDRVAERREQMLARLARARRGLWKAVLAGDPAAVRTYVRLEEREARLLGLDAPTKVQVTDALDQEIEALMAQLAAVQQHEQEVQP